MCGPPSGACAARTTPNAIGRARRCAPRRVRRPLRAGAYRLRGDRELMAARSPQHAALGLAIRQLRRASGVSQEAFATSCGLHRTYVGGIERGERNVSFANLLRIADALDVRPSELMSRYEHFLHAD